MLYRCAAVILVATALASGVGGISGAGHAKSLCRSDQGSPEVVLTIDPGKVALNNGHSRGQLAALRGRNAPPSPLGARWKPVGLTLTERQFTMRVQVRARRAAKGHFCGYLTKVTARIGYDKLNVYVARKYRPGSCQYRSILDHENRHVAVFRNTLVKYAPRVERRIRRLASRMPPAAARSADATAKILQNKLQRGLKPLFREMDREMDFRNSKLDTPQNYRQEQARCSGW